MPIAEGSVHPGAPIIATGLGTDATSAVPSTAIALTRAAKWQLLDLEITGVLFASTSSVFVSGCR